MLYVKFLHHKFFKKAKVNRNVIVAYKIPYRKDFICLVIRVCRKNVWNKNYSRDLCRIQTTSFKTYKKYSWAVVIAACHLTGFHVSPQLLSSAGNFIAVGSGGMARREGSHGRTALILEEDLGKFFLKVGLFL